MGVHPTTWADATIVIVLKFPNKSETVRNEDIAEAAEYLVDAVRAIPADQDPRENFFGS